MNATDHLSAAPDVPEPLIDRFEDALRGRGGPAEIAREVARLVIEEARYLPRFEASLRIRLASDGRAERVAAAVALQGISVGLEQLGDRAAAVERESVETLVAALAVEVDLSVKLELLSALAAQDFDAPDLRPLAALAGQIAARAVEGPGDLDTVTEQQLVLLHDRLRASGRVDPDGLLDRRERTSIVGYAATGIPFVLTDPARPEVVLIYNDNLDAWLPPGGHFNPDTQEVPSQTLVRKIATEAGADSIVHWAPGLKFEPGTDAVQLHPAPSFVLLEDLRQHPRRNPSEVHTHHFDLNYICRITDQAASSIGSGEKHAIRVPLDRVAAVADRRRYITERVRETADSEFPELSDASIFPDVVERILLSLELLAGDWDSKLYTFELNGSANGHGEPVLRLVDPPAAGLFPRGGS